MIKSFYFQHIFNIETFGASLGTGANVFTGASEVGLSHLKNAIRFALTGGTPGGIAPELLANVKVDKPAPKCIIGLDKFGKSYGIERRISPNFVSVNEIATQFTRHNTFSNCLDNQGISNLIMQCLTHEDLFHCNPETQGELIKYFYAGGDGIDLSKFEIDPEYMADLEGVNLLNIKEYRSKFSQEIRDYKRKAEVVQFNSKNLKGIMAEDVTKADIETIQIEILQLTHSMRNEIPVTANTNDIVDIRSQIDHLKNQTYNAKYANYISKWKSDVRDNTQRILDLQEYSDDKCPIHADISCGCKTQFVEIIDLHQKAVEDAEAKLKDLEIKEEESRQGWQNEINKNIDEYTQKLKGLVETFESEVEAVKIKNIEIKKHNSELQRQLDSANLKLDDFNRIMGAQAERDSKLRELESYQRYLLHYENLISILDTIGKSLIISHKHPSQLLDKINAVSNRYGIRITQEDSGLFINRVHYLLCSDTTRMISGIISNSIFAEESGYGFYVCDNFEKIPLDIGMDLLEWVDKQNVSALILGREIPESIMTPGIKQKMKTMSEV